MEVGFKKKTSNIDYVSLGQIEMNGAESIQFFKKKKEGDKYVVDEIFEGGVVGTVIGIFNDSYVYKDETQKTFVLFLDMGGKVAKITMNQNYPTRGFVNCLFDVEDFSKLVSIWTSIDKGGYSRIWLKEDGRVYPDNFKTSSWKYSMSDMPEVKEVKVAGKTIKDTTALEEWFVGKVVELNKQIGVMNDMNDIPETEGGGKKVTASIVEGGDDGHGIVDGGMGKAFKAVMSKLEMCADPSSILNVQDSILAKLDSFDGTELKALHDFAQTQMTILHGNPDLIKIETDLPF